MPPQLDTKIVTSIASIDAAAWDRLAGDGDPFVEHAFLASLEQSKSVGAGTGWEPMHVTVWKQNTLVAALPLYLKTHSYGEYIFDWAWADAAARLGVGYYPKLVAMVPVTPVTGRRLLLSDDVDPQLAVRRLLDACFEVAELTAASSLHLLFLTEEEQRLVDTDGRLMRRLSHQFHWTNDGYTSFDDFVGRFRASMRKKLNKERRVVRDSSYEIVASRGDELTDKEWIQLSHLYRATCHRKGSFPYLTPEFFELAPRRLGHRALIISAKQEGQTVAASINFQKGAQLYGRYWGATEQHDMLHFELCYYRLIEHAIAEGLGRFEAGAQGTHKLRRGLLPRPIYSSHWIRHRTLRNAVHDFLPREERAVRAEMERLTYHGPFRRESSSSQASSKAK